MHLVARETLPEPNSQGTLFTGGISYLNTHQSGQISYRLFDFFFMVEKSQVLVVFCEAHNGVL